MTLQPGIAAAVLAAASLLFLVIGVLAARRRRRSRRRAATGWRLLSATGGLFALVLLLAAAVCGALALSVQGYRALTREEVAAVVEIQPLVEQRFIAHVTLADGTTRSFQLAGDQLYVDARVLKWHALANLLGLHTQYALDRIGGRYLDIEDERNAPRTVFSLAEGAPLDAFVLRRKHELLAPLVDASYGSATFTEADRATTLEVRVSTTGLLVRERSDRGRAAEGGPAAADPALARQ